LRAENSFHSIYHELYKGVMKNKEVGPCEGRARKNEEISHKRKTLNLFAQVQRLHGVVYKQSPDARQSSHQGKKFYFLGSSF